MQFGIKTALGLSIRTSDVLFWYCIRSIIGRKMMNWSHRWYGTFKVATPVQVEVDGGHGKYVECDEWAASDSGR